MTPLRSAEWFDRDDELGLQNRAVLRVVGWDPGLVRGKPIIGIANSWSELNNCNLNLRAVADAVKRGVVAAGGVLALARDGGLIALDIPARTLNLLVDEDELARRRAAWRPPQSPHRRGYPKLYQQHVLQPDEGCDFDFLRPQSDEDLAFVPPLVGRS